MVEGLRGRNRAALPDPSTGSAGPPPRTGEVFSITASTLSGQAGILFGWTPDTFWAATPAELATLVRAASGGGEVSAPVDLAALMERYPDE